MRQATDNLLTALLILSGILHTAADFIRNIYCDRAKNIDPHKFRGYKIPLWSQILFNSS